MVQGQVLRFKRERDTFKHMLEAAQKTISDLKAAGATPRSSLSLDDVSIKGMRKSIDPLAWNLYFSFSLTMLWYTKSMMIVQKTDL